MKIKGITETELRSIVAYVSRTLYGDNLVFKREPENSGNFLLFTLTVLKSKNPGGRRSNTGRRIAAACWHAHRDVMLAIFEQSPGALLVSALARYDGQADFLATFPSTGRINLGSIVKPLRADCACNCEAFEMVRVHNSIVRKLNAEY